VSGVNGQRELLSPTAIVQPTAHSQALYRRTDRCSCYSAAHSPQPTAHSPALYHYRTLFMLQRSPRPIAVSTDRPLFLLQRSPQPTAHSPQPSTVPTDTPHNIPSASAHCYTLLTKCPRLFVAPDTIRPFSGRPYCHRKFVNVGWKYVIHMDYVITADCE
jgi:hypothetical protein